MLLDTLCIKHKLVSAHFFFFFFIFIVGTVFVSLFSLIYVFSPLRLTMLIVVGTFRYPVCNI